MLETIIKLNKQKTNLLSKQVQIVSDLLDVQHDITILQTVLEKEIHKIFFSLSSFNGRISQIFELLYNFELTGHTVYEINTSNKDIFVTEGDDYCNNAWTCINDLTRHLEVIEPDETCEAIDLPTGNAIVYYYNEGNYFLLPSSYKNQNAMLDASTVVFYKDEDFIAALFI